MKKKLKNKLLKVLLGSTIVAPIVATLPSLIIPTTNNSSILNSSLNSATKQTKVLNFDWTEPTASSGQTYSFDNNEDNSNNSLNAPMQNKAIDETNTSFATISSSNASANKKDQIAKFWLNSTTQIEQDSNDASKTKETVSIPGERQWLVKLSELGSKIGVNDTTKLEITSIFYSTGGETVSKALFVIVHSTDTTIPGSFLFQIKYENDVKEENLKSKKAGSYRLAKQLSTNVSDKYNFGTIDGTSTHTMYVYKVPELTANGGQDYTIDYLRLGNSNFGDNNSVSSKKIKIESSSISSNFISSKKYYPIFAYRSSSLGGNTYIFYQIEKYNSSDKDKAVVAVKINLSSNNDNSSSDIIVDPNSIKPIKFNDNNNFVDNNIFGTTFLEQNSSTYELFFSQKGASKDNSALRVTFDFDFSTTKNYETKAFDKLTLQKDKYIIDVRKIYVNQTSNVDGYVFLDNDNKVYKLDRNFENAKLIYDFNASTYDLGNIKRIFTVPGNGSWFAQKSDSNLVQFSNGTLIGQLDTIYKENSYELPLSISLISQDALDPSVSYKKLSNDSNDYDSSFKNFLNSPDAYKSFFNINFQDPRFTQNPSIKIVPKSGDFNKYSQDVKETESGSKKYEIELHFKQTLRQIDKSGQVTSQTKEIIIASQKYVFNNASGKITFAKSKDGEDTFEVPAFIKNKLPSQITKEEVENYLVKYENVSNVRILSNPDDSKGQLTVNVSVPYMWDGSEFKTNQNFSKVYTEFFQSDRFGNAAKVTPYDDDYFAYINDDSNNNEYEKSKRQNLLTSLKSKYSSVLPSSLSVKEMLDSFAEYGPAFRQTSNIDDGLIELPKLTDIIIIPYDTEGYANININFPKIDSKTNVKVSFNTPKIFLKNKLAGTNVFFKFKDQKDVVSLLETSTNLNFGNTNATTIASKLNSSSNSDKSVVVSYLRSFAEFGNYFDKSIIDGDTIVSAEGNDSYGSLKISVGDKNGSVLLPGYGKNTIENIFTGFKQTNSSSLTNDSFSFGDLNNIANISPLDVNADYLRRNNAFNFSGNSSTQSKLKDSNIELIPSTISGTLQVTVNLENYVENNKVVPYKSFTKLYTGFRKSKDSVDMIVWKSISEINADNPGYSNNRPSVIINTINDSGSSKSDLDKLKVFSNISNDLEKSINDNNGSVSIIMSADDSKGILNISASITINGQLTALNTSISGFANDGTLASSVIFDSPEIKQALSQFQKDNRTPSSITKPEASRLYELKNASWYSKDVTLIPDDAKGTLVISVMILDKDGNQILEKPATNEFLGFTKFIPTDTGTNWGIVAASIIVPAIIFIIPIVVMGIYQERIQMKRISRVLDRRLTEEYKKMKKIS